MKPEVCLCMALRRATREATRLYDERMKGTGLKITQFSLLRNIGRAGTINVTELARMLDLERTAMGRNLDVLERMELIESSEKEDLRNRCVSLTGKGKEAETAAVPVWEEAQAEMRRRLSQGELGSLAAVMEVMGN